ncbi:hypothetical protein INT47_002310 [Mucor saturninus]|uniref:TATA element modulatory factor 1 TATA binding domain-containing protein n=1 Tax=Mucor saturninus TaxID=64648 RepID=A0A8H7QJF2_9FUNG|nr:hypothetical protein INT47_002310 [Mucor saturninus]
MSGFFGSNDSTSRWGGLLKQAISNVETTFDSLLEQPPQQQQQSQQTKGKYTDTETYMDPISGMVTTIERPRTAPLPPPAAKKDEQTKVLQESRSSLDLSTRLAAVMAEKKKKNKEPVSTTPIIPTTEAPTKEGTIESTKEIKEVTPSTTEVAVEQVTEEAPVKEIVQKVQEDIVENTPAKEEIVEPTQQVDITPKENEEKEVETQVELVDTTPSNPKKDTDTKDDKDRILEQRETQLLQAMENIANLHDQIHQIQEEADTKVRTALQQLEAAESNTSSPANLAKTVKRLEASLDDLKKQMASKEEKIQGLMLEGEKLSKVELRHSTLIKKLRLEKADVDKTLLDQTKKLEKAMTDLSQASEKGSKQSETEKRLQDSVKLLSDLSEQQTKHINKLESEKIATTKKSSETELALKKALESMDDERTKAKLEAEQVNAAALEKEIKANDRLHKELTKTSQDAQSLESKLRKEIRDLQIALQTVEEQGGLREDALRKEVADLQTKLQLSDNKMEDISATVDEATAPLLRQIEELQTQHALAIKNRDQAEQSIIIRMQTAEAEHKKTVEKDEKLQADIKSLNRRLEQSEAEIERLLSKIKTLEAQVKADAMEKKQLEDRVATLVQKIKELNEKEIKDQEGLKTQYQRLMRERVNEEKKQFELRLKAERANHISSNQEQQQQDTMVINTSHHSPPSVSSRSSFDSSSTTPVVSSILVERLQANIRQLENQLNFYQTQLQSSAQSRDELSEEVLSMSQEIETLRKETKRTHEVEKQLEQLNQRYHTLLELLGERTEEVEELKADLIDVKEMYKTQILDLVQKIDQLSKK